MDSHAVHKHPDLSRWLAANRRVTVHFTRASWMNLVEVASH